MIFLAKQIDDSRYMVGKSTIDRIDVYPIFGGQNQKSILARRSRCSHCGKTHFEMLNSCEENLRYSLYVLHGHIKFHKRKTSFVTRVKGQF
jgi:hypothetical protein